jgi:predicted signal transduction protein with EAL and GGDEF domain
LRVIAEGLESEEQVERLIDLGCRWGQGYHYSRPKAAGELEQLLARQGVKGWVSIPVAPLSRETQRSAELRRFTGASL